LKVELSAELEATRAVGDQGVEHGGQDEAGGDTERVYRHDHCVFRRRCRVPIAELAVDHQGKHEEEYCAEQMREDVDCCRQ